MVKHCMNSYKERYIRNFLDHYDWLHCEKCGTSNGPFDVHHKIKRSQGGGDDPENLILLCRICHGREHGIKVLT